MSHVIDGTHPYTDSGVRHAYQLYGDWATRPSYTLGGAQGTISTSVDDVIAKVFSDSPEAMMVRQSAAAGDRIAAQYPDLKYGTDYDLFQEPGAQRSHTLHGSTDWMMAFSNSAAVKALAAYLSCDRGSQMWAQVGFGNTPNSTGANATQTSGCRNRLSSWQMPPHLCRTLARPFQVDLPAPRGRLWWTLSTAPPSPACSRTSRQLRSQPWAGDP